MDQRFRVGALAWVALLSAGLIVAGCGPDYPNCDDDDDCHEAEFCVNGRCQMCRSNADCEAGQQCSGGRCNAIPGYCTGPDDCPEGMECRSNQCVAPAQTQTDVPEPASTDTGCTLQPVRFAFDSDALEGEARNVLEANARCIQQRNLQGVHLTGHTDPRGTEEYNLALGDRRARSAMQFLTSLGVEAGRLTSSSMGEEMAQGTDETSWGNDRRVEFSQR